MKLVRYCMSFQRLMIPEANTLLAHNPLVMNDRNILWSITYSALFIHGFQFCVLDTLFCFPKNMESVLNFLIYPPQTPGQDMW